MFGTVNLLNLLHFLSLRSAADAQAEIGVYALAMRDLVREVVPTCITVCEEEEAAADPAPRLSNELEPSARCGGCDYDH
jgi:thymidylate synthase ThyX